MNADLVPSRRSVLRASASAAVAGTAGCFQFFEASEFSQPVAGTVRQQQVDGSRSGHVRGVSGPRSDASLVWSNDVGDYVHHSPVVRDSTVYVGARTSNEGIVRALDASVGTGKWTTNLDHDPVSVALYEGGVLACTGFDVHRLSDHDGDEINATATGGASSIALDRDRAYFHGTRHLHAIPHNFERQGWSTELDRIASGPATDGRRVYVGTYDDELLAYTTDGVLDWRSGVGRDVTGAPTIAADVVLVGAVDFAVHAVSRETGVPRWRHETDGAVYGSPAVADGIVYVTSVDGTVRALDVDDGREQWRYDAGDGLRTGYRAGPIVDDATVFVGGIGGEIAALDAATGDELWTVTVGDTPVAPPTIAEGHVYVGTVSGTVYGIGGVVES